MLENVRFQSTRPRGARRNGRATLLRWDNVSIHAPAWGATAVAEFSHPQGGVSIHAPAWGATLHALIIGYFASFQSTRPRGARLLIPSSQLLLDTFQSTRPRGARHGWDELALKNKAFQSTRPRGARLIKWLKKLPLEGFNPRARVGRDVSCGVGCGVSTVSIHAPAWGATARILGRAGGSVVSIHAPAWGATYSDRHTA